MWNRWREGNLEIAPDLSHADLRNEDIDGANLSGANLGSANLSGAFLQGANLSGANLGSVFLVDADIEGANLSGAFLESANLWRAFLSQAKLGGANLSGAYCIKANLGEANLGGANLSNANFAGADLSGTDLKGANLSATTLSGADLSGADLSGADLSGARLSFANFNDALLRDTNLANAEIGYTVFAGTDLSSVTGLESVKHDSPSTIGTDTLVNSKDQIPEVFLRGCGLRDWEIESAKLYNPDLSNEEINDTWYRIHDLRVRRAFQINPLFISYSHSNTDFVDALEKYLINQGIRFWRDIHHAKAGRLEKQIDAAIHLNDVVLLVLSTDSTSSDWVEHEVRKAREKEKKSGKDALCPVALDNSWKTCRWPERLREQIQEYNILDFANWHDAADFQRMFARLLEGLNLFYK